MSYKELEEEILALAKSKDMLDDTTPVSTTIREVNKLIEALSFQERGVNTYVNSEHDMVSTTEEIKKALCNSFITLVVQMKSQHLSLEECLQNTNKNYEGPTIM